MRLHWHPFSIIPRRVRIALAEKGIDYESVEVDLPGGEHRGEGFRALNPFSQVPVLEDGDLVIAESVAILEYLEETHPSPALMPHDPAGRARCRQWMLFAGDYVNDAWKLWMAQYFDPDTKADAPSVQEGRQLLARHLDVLDTALGSHDWLVGTFSFAEACYAPVVTVPKLTLFPLVSLHVPVPEKLVVEGLV